MRVFVSADIEGVAGIAHDPSTGPGRFDHEAESPLDASTTLGRAAPAAERPTADDAAAE